MTDRRLILGGPGTGKTERLMREVERHLTAGVPPDRLALVTFTTAGAAVARDRAMKQFGLEPKQLPHFRTIHSLCFRELGLSRRDVLGDEHLEEVAELTGELYDNELAGADGTTAGIGAHPLLTIDNYARTTCVPLERAWEQHGGDVEWHRQLRFSEAQRLYKQDQALLDFTDMLELYVDGGTPLDVEFALVDEAQDLTPLQWAVVHKAFSRSRQLTAVGDDDQAIHVWAGAAGDYLLGLDWEREVLPVSHRLTNEVFGMAQSVVKRIERRWDKPQRASGRTGQIEWVGSPEDVDLRAGTWLLLARTRSQLAELADVARWQGVLYSLKGRPSADPEHVRAIRAYETLRGGHPVEATDAALVLRFLGRPVPEMDDYAIYGPGDIGVPHDAPLWHDALIKIPVDDREYYLACLRGGEKLTQPPRIRIETFHGAKGLEAENALLITDLTYRTHRAFEQDPDAEHRVMYVGITRASERLHLVAPRTAYGFQL